MYSREEILGRKTVWREYQKNPSTADAFPIGLAASFTIESTVPFVGAALLSRSIQPAVHVAPYGQLMQTCFDPVTAFETDKLKAACALWRIEDIGLRELRDWINGDEQAMDRFERTLTDLGGAIQTLQHKLNAPVLVSMPPYPDLPESSPAELTSAWTVARFHRRVCTAWSQILADIEGVHVVDMDALQRWYGFEASHDTRKRYLYRQPYAEGFLLALGEQIGQIIGAVYLPQKKCIAVDCDNTLWGGIVGEDGVDGLALGDEFPGSAFADLQRLLLHWKHQGVLLAILSKNNEPEVWDVFDRHDGMVLTRKDIAAWRIDWNAKSENIRQIASELNIGIDSFVFLDDNPVEVEAMRAVLPEVGSVLLHEEPAHMVDHLKSLRLFERLTLSAEDRARTDMIAQERERNQLKTSISQEEFLTSLDLTVDLFRPEHEHIGRIAQLINKTNQFNLTTIRRTEEEVRALLDSEDYAVYAARIGDRFGDYGLTGLVILHRLNDEDWDLDTFLMSCRVLGRGVETALMASCIENIAAFGARRIIGRYIKTDRNAPVATLLPDHGFAPNGNGSDVLDTSCAPSVPGHIRVASS